MPYTPTFLAELRDGNVKEISSTGETVQGEFKKDVDLRGRDGRRTSRPRSRPSPTRTSSPSSWRSRTSRSTRSRSAAARCSRRSCSASARRSCSSGSSSGSSAARPPRAAGGGCSAASGARAPSASKPRPRARRSTTSPASTRPRTSSSRSSTSCATRTSTSRSARGSRKGVLLVGAPGHRQDAAGARDRRRGRRPVLHRLSASEFIEMIVGVGASRVRDLFEQAKEAAPCDHLHRRARRDRPRARQRQARSAATTSASRRSTRSSPRWTASTPSTASSCSAATQPAGRARRGAAAAGPLRPPRHGAGARHGRARSDPRGPHALGAARRRTSTSSGSPPTTPGMVGADLANLVNEAALLAAQGAATRVALERLHATRSRRSCSAPSARSC